MNIPVSEAKAKFAEIIRRAEAGEEIVLTKHGKPVVKLVAEHEAKKRRILGIAKGQFWMADDFDELGPEWDEYT
jgi:prevent-host-death family protein